MAAPTINATRAIPKIVLISIVVPPFSEQYERIQISGYYGSSRAKGQHRCKRNGVFECSMLSQGMDHAGNKHWQHKGKGYQSYNFV